MNKQRINKDIDLTIAGICIFLGVLAIIFMPTILTSSAIAPWLDFSSTGQIGDTIGGITAPFLSLVGSALVFLALKSQIRANQIIVDQRKKDNERAKLNQLFQYINENVNNFTFNTLPREYLHNEYDIPSEISGARAFYKLFDQIVFKFHGDQKILDINPSVIELIDILKSLSYLISQIEESDAPNSKLLKNLIKQLFFFKITPRISSLNEGDLDVNYCEECKATHGIPENIKKLIIEIRDKLFHAQEISVTISGNYFNFPAPDTLHSYDLQSYITAMEKILTINENGQSKGQFRIKENGSVQGIPLFINSNVKNELLKNEFIKSIEMKSNQDYIVSIKNFDLPKYGISKIEFIEEE